MKNSKEKVCPKATTKKLQKFKQWAILKPGLVKGGTEKDGTSDVDIVNVIDW